MNCARPTYSRPREQGALTQSPGRPIRTSARLLAALLLLSGAGVASAVAQDIQPVKGSKALPRTACAGQSKSSDPGTSGTQQAGEEKQPTLNLSTRSNADREAAETGQFCRREHNDKDLQPRLDKDVSGDAHDPPIASFNGDMVQIRSHGRPLAQVLDALRSATGLQIDGDTEVETDPVYLDLGPVSLQDALKALLQGTRYNYIIQGSAGSTSMARALILSPRDDGKNPTAIAPAIGSPPPGGPALYGQGFQEAAPTVAEAAPADLPPPVESRTIPSSVPTNINVQQMAAQSNKSVGQVLSELQQKQQEMLDQQAAQTSQ